MAESVLERRLEIFGRAQLALLGFDEVFARRVRDRVAEGLDAVNVKVFQHEGTVVVDEPRVDFTERRLSAELAAKLLDWMPSKIEHEVHGEVGFTILGLDPERV
jgi:hypothetical protein